MVARFRVGELVVRKSHQEDMVFKVEAVGRGIAVLRSVETRLMADAPLDDLRRAARPPRHERQDATAVEPHRGRTAI